MAYDTNSTHPIGLAIVKGTGNADAPDFAEQAEWVYATDSAASVQSLSLPNTYEVRLRNNDGSVSVFAYDANETDDHDGVEVLADNDGRRFVITERVLTQAQFDALTPRSSVRYYIIPAS